MICAVIFFSNCANNSNKTITVKNTLDFDRNFEVIEIEISTIKTDDVTKIGIKNTKTGTLEITQLVDTNGDEKMDQILFQPNIPANEAVVFEIVEITKGKKPNAALVCYSRFVPERTDDYAWENNVVAFRTFGPNAQYRAENGLKEPTLTSGIDAWLKRVEYPIINKWYKKYTEKTGTYHEDTGEGLDNFHVGSSRGVGGIAVKSDTSYYFSKNFTNWKTYTTGPLRTSFYLEYEDWDANGKLVKETKTITLDKHNYFSKIEVTIDGTNEISAGLTLHEKDGKVNGNSEKGWLSYWQPHVDSEIGTAIVAEKNVFSGYEKYDVATKDLSNAYAHLNVNDGKVTYYAGFGWKKASKFTTNETWENYLNTFAKAINNPLEVSYNF